MTDKLLEPWLKIVVVLDAQGSECPADLKDAVREFAEDFEMGDDTFMNWRSGEYGKDFPVIDEYLKSQYVTDCLIIWRGEVDKSSY
jgi:hypothetical protein